MSRLFHFLEDRVKVIVSIDTIEEDTVKQGALVFAASEESGGLVTISTESGQAQVQVEDLIKVAALVGAFYAEATVESE